jgi:ABC-type glycerol-3-phosphate transport system substrate-binding protein
LARAGQALAAVLGAAAAACGRGAPGAGKPLGGEPITLRVTSVASEMGEMAASRYPAFTEKFPRIKVEFENNPEYGTKITVLAAADSLGDLAMGYTNTGQYHFLAQNDVFSDHDAFIARDKYDLKQFYDLAVEAIRINKKLYGLPFKGQIARIALFWNVDAFEARGIRQPAPEWTYNDLADAAVRLARRDGTEVQMYGVVFNWRELTSMIGSIRPWGGDVLSADGKRVTLATPQAREALVYHYDLALRQRVATMQPLVADPVTLFTDGKAAMLARVNIGNAGLILQRFGGAQRFRWNMVRMPKGPGGRRGGMWLPGTMSVTKSSRHQDEAWELCKWSCDKEAGVALALQVQGSSTPGARPDVYADPRLANRPGYPAQYADEQRRAMQEPEPYVTAWNFTGGDLNTALGTELDKITRGEAPVSDPFLQAVAAQLQTILDKPPPRLRS